MDKKLYIVAATKAEAELWARKKHLGEYVYVDHEMYLVAKSGAYIEVVEVPGATSLKRYRRIRRELGRIAQEQRQERASSSAGKYVMLVAKTNDEARHYAKQNGIKRFERITHERQLLGTDMSRSMICFVPGCEALPRFREIHETARRRKEQQESDHEMQTADMVDVSDARQETML